MPSTVMAHELASGDKFYEGLDADRTPRLFVPESYLVRGSGRLERLAGRAFIQSQLFPDGQYDVVWHGSEPSAFFRGGVYPTGAWVSDGFGLRVEGSDRLFLSYIDYEDGVSVDERIQHALAHGAGVFKPADLARRYQD